MELKQVLGMKKGDGENSYVKTSLYTQKIAAMTMPMVDRVVQSLFRSPNFFSCDVLNIADLGCSSGPNTFLVMSTMLQSIANKCSELKTQIPEIQFYLNDLPSNDFNTLFKGLSVFSQKYVDQYSCFFAVVSGSFHGRFFPRNKLQLVNCSDHIGSLRQAYLSQFQEDFLSFLKSRSLGLVPDGLMLLFQRAILHPMARGSSRSSGEGGIFYNRASRKDGDGDSRHEFMANTGTQGEECQVLYGSMISAQFGEDVTDKLYDKFKEIHVASCMQGREPTHAISIPRAKEENNLNL
ncbi:hypothetical protein SLA2020_247900 [Shorea laevis]